MTDKYCPLRFREYDSNPHDQRCIGESCAWFEKCSQSHGEPRTDTVETQTRVCTETDTETAQEPREADENANDVDTREKLDAEVRKWCGMYAYQADMVWVWLNRQAAITERHWMEIVGASANANVELKRQIDELQAQLDKLSSDELHWHSEADYWKRQYELICRAVEDVARNYTVIDEGMA